MSPTVRFLGSDEYDIAVCSFEVCWAPGHILAQDKNLFDWMFKRTDIWQRDDYSFAVAMHNDRPVGQLGGIPFEFNNFGEHGMGVWTANWRVHQDARSGPLALQLLEQFRREWGDLVMLFGMTPLIEPLMRGLKYQIVPGIPRFLGIFPERLAQFHHLMQTAHSGTAADEFAELEKLFLLDQERTPELEIYRTIPENWDHTTWKSLSRRSIGAARNSAFLKWRYVDHPSYHYRLVGIDHDDGPALAVWRKEKIFTGDSPSGTAAIGAFGRVIEFLANGPAAGRALVSALIEDLYDQNVFAADFIGYHGETGQALIGSGFGLVEKQTCRPEIPFRFQPIDTETSDLLSCILVDDTAPGGTFDAGSPWIWTKGDADMDRPRPNEGLEVSA